MKLTKRYHNKFIPLFVLAPFVLGSGVLAAVTTTTPSDLEQVRSVASSMLKGTYRPQNFAVVVPVSKTNDAVGTTVVHGLRVTLGGIKDSRCPRGVECIWAGEVKTSLAIQDSTQKDPVVFVDVRANDESVRYGNWNVSISLKNGVSSEKENKSPYVFVVKFSKAAKNIPSSTSVIMGVVEGRVLVSPACPVVSVDQPCPDKPIEMMLSIFDTTKGSFVRKFKSAPDGTFSIGLPEGTYRFEHFETHDTPALLPRISPAEFTIVSGKTTPVTVTVDTGIR